MGPLLADVRGIQQYFSGEFFLESETPGLLIRNVPTDPLYRTYRVESDVVDRSEGAPRGRCDAAACRIGERAGGVFQGVVRGCMVDVQSGQPGRLNVEALVAPRAGAGGAAAWGRKVDTVSSANHKGMGQLIGKAEARLDGLSKRFVIVAGMGAGKDFGPMQCVKNSRHGERRDRIWIQPVHAIEPLGARQRAFIAKAQVQRELWSHFVVVMAKERVPEALSTDKVVESLLARSATTAAVLRIAYTSEEAGERVSASAFVGNARDLRCGPTVKLEVAGRPARLDEVDSMQAAFRAELKVMFAAKPTYRASEVMRVLPFAEYGERLRADGRVVAVAKFDKRKRVETGVEIGRKSGAGIQRTEIRELSADAM